MNASCRSMFTRTQRREDRRVLVTLKGRKTWVSKQRAQAMVLEELVSLSEADLSALIHQFRKLTGGAR